MFSRIHNLYLLLETVVYSNHIKAGVVLGPGYWLAESLPFCLTFIASLHYAWLQYFGLLATNGIDPVFLNRLENW
jgi:hypothetical protein